MDAFINNNSANKKKIVVAIIGTAGRDQKDIKHMTRQLYDNMIKKAERIITDDWGLTWENVTLISGGAAFSDHVAVSLFLKHHPKVSLTLELPCKWDGNKLMDIGGNVFDWKKNPGRTSNWYHKIFSERVGLNPFNDIQEAIKKGARIIESKGFFDRNAEISKKSDRMIAFSFTPSKTPDDKPITKPIGGGTENTWNSCVAKHKIHISLETIFELEDKPTQPEGTHKRKPANEPGPNKKQAI